MEFNENGIGGGFSDLAFVFKGFKNATAAAFEEGMAFSMPRRRLLRSGIHFGGFLGHMHTDHAHTQVLRPDWGVPTARECRRMRVYYDASLY